MLGYLYCMLKSRFLEILPPSVEGASLRHTCTRQLNLTVQRGVTQPATLVEDGGALITVVEGGGCGYAATSDLSRSGLREAVEKARKWAKVSGRFPLVSRYPRFSSETGEYRTPTKRPWDLSAVGGIVERLHGYSGQLFGGDSRVIQWRAGVWLVSEETEWFSTEGGHWFQQLNYGVPKALVTVSDQGKIQSRSLHGTAATAQGGLEIFDLFDVDTTIPTLREEAFQLLSAPVCPDDVRDLLLSPDQMILQIHESIGHPLELDRILGDERNFAGDSFVTLEDFGRLQYGSELLNITFDPTVSSDMATYRWDDDGRRAEKVHLIQDGRLLRGIGGVLSQQRSGVEGIASERSSNWNRAPIDRMANINLEPGQESFDALVARTERGVLMKTNCAWSIDASRNKFQFGCEVGQLIEDGQLGALVRKPNYRGVSQHFWRSLKGVGDRASMGRFGAPNCGKGEPNQVIRVGHASPWCLFDQVQVFGGQ